MPHAGPAGRARVRVNAVYGPGQHAPASLLVPHGRGHGQRWNVDVECLAPRIRKDRGLRPRRARRVSSSRRVRQLAVGAGASATAALFTGRAYPGRSSQHPGWSSRPRRVRGVAASLSVSACTAPAVPVRAAGKRRLSRPLLTIARCPPALSWNSGVPPRAPWWVSAGAARHCMAGSRYPSMVTTSRRRRSAGRRGWTGPSGECGPDPPDGRTREDRAFGGIRPAGPVGPTTSRRAPPGDASAGAVFCGRRVNDVYCPAASSPRTTAGFVRPPVGCRRRRDCRRGSVRLLRATSSATPALMRNCVRDGHGGRALGSLPGAACGYDTQDASLRGAHAATHRPRPSRRSPHPDHTTLAAVA
ncbi:hypothetical protein Psed_6705 (plasmid) [Pseudonocardia dioxanivorans CB1190]|uniref:Uncharacterized protein n=1 Tax=Pseudonocardia dioxanivorans (strain ATCC 55486 / DSM 44775 / JCM 13855 / CB1190) TaxID=675635 RepID=F2L6R8_PSEUX|nr:hypothetical protein Psed_6705 [Pseudonocardia dioxanivorans CB1190]